MSELLWTLSLLAQKHLVQSTSVEPLSALDTVDSELAIAQSNLEAQSMSDSVAPVELLEPSPLEFSSVPSQATSGHWSHQAKPTELKVGDRLPSTALNSQGHSSSLTAVLSESVQQLVKVPTPQSKHVSAHFQVPAIILGSMPFPEFVDTPFSTMRPMSGSQLYAQRLEALRTGQTYTRLPSNSFHEVWQNATYHPQYEDWLGLLKQEADAMARGQGNNNLTVILGDSLSQWFPNDQLPSDRFWLNQGISGDTSAGVLRRLSFIDGTTPDVIHVMVGINDLRSGATDAEVLSNLEQIMRGLRQRHPEAQVYVYSLLPTRLPEISNERITALNQAIAQTADIENVAYLDLQTTFADEQGNLRLDLTTDGLHLSRYGYAMWQSALRWFQLA